MAKRSRSTSCGAGVSRSAPWANGSSRSEAATARAAVQAKREPHLTRHACSTLPAEKCRFHHGPQLWPVESRRTVSPRKTSSMPKRGWAPPNKGTIHHHFQSSAIPGCDFRKHQVEVPQQHVGGLSTSSFSADATCHALQSPPPFAQNPCHTGKQGGDAATR